MIEAISEAAAGELAASITLLCAGLATIIQISPIKISPWTWLARAIGRAINQEVIEKVDKIESDFSQFKYDRERDRAKSARTRVLRFGDELLHDVRHSKEHFDDALRDITEYENYCKDHPEFENDQMVITSQHLKQTYQKCLENHSFL